MVLNKICVRNIKTAHPLKQATNEYWRLFEILFIKNKNIEKNTRIGNDVVKWANMVFKKRFNFDSKLVMLNFLYVCRYIRGKKGAQYCLNGMDVGGNLSRRGQTLDSSQNFFISSIPTYFIFSTGEFSETDTVNLNNEFGNHILFEYSLLLVSP